MKRNMKNSLHQKDTFVCLSQLNGSKKICKAQIDTCVVGGKIIPEKSNKDTDSM